MVLVWVVWWVGLGVGKKLGPDPETNATIRLKSNLGQNLITNYFNKALKKIQTGSAAAYAAQIASQTGSVSTNETRAPRD